MIKYDFENGEWPDDERTPYKLMRWWFLDCYYTYSRSKIHYNARLNKGWVANEHEIGYAYEQYESAYRMPIEKVMLEVLCLILNGGRGLEQFDSHHRKLIGQILEKNNLQDMLKELPKEERNEFEHDLKLLGIMS